MMKATALKRGSRKKQQQDPNMKDDTPKQPQQPLPSAVNNNTGNKQPQTLQPAASAADGSGCGPPKRKQNEEIAALTTKNYRLAKELVRVVVCSCSSQ
jgi:hypothetical protein